MKLKKQIVEGAVVGTDSRSKVLIRVLRCSYSTLGVCAPH